MKLPLAFSALGFEILFLFNLASFSYSTPIIQETSTGCSSTKYIVPGSLWLDTDGALIQAHGGGMAKVNNTFYWFGEDHTPGGPNFQGYVCINYSAEFH